MTSVIMFFPRAYRTSKDTRVNVITMCQYGRHILSDIPPEVQLFRRSYEEQISPNERFWFAKKTVSLHGFFSPQLSRDLPSDLVTLLRERSDDCWKEPTPPYKGTRGE